jgi:hypothetical protein
MEHVMKRNALDYARETVKMYSDQSILNPYNRYTVGNPISGNDRLKWNDHLENIKIITYLETILERLPYDPKVTDG